MEIIYVLEEIPVSDNMIFLAGGTYREKENYHIMLIS